MAFHYNTIYMVSDFSAFGIWIGNVTIYITESLQDAADTMDALQEVLQVPISPSVFHRNCFFFLFFELSAASGATRTWFLLQCVSLGAPLFYL